MNILYNCEKCGKEVFVKFGSGRFCSRSCANGHEHTNTSKQKISKALKKDLPKFFCKSCGKIIRKNKSGFCKFCLVNTQDGQAYLSQKISSACKGVGGGYRQGSGRGRHGWYKGFYCDSSWELAYVIYNIDHNISFVRNTKKFPYNYNGEQHNYMPDFIENGIYVELKGIKNDLWEAKLKAFPEKIKVLYNKDIKQYINYAESKYGKTFWDVYEK